MSERQIEDNSENKMAETADCHWYQCRNKSEKTETMFERQAKDKFEKKIAENVACHRQQRCPCATAALLMMALWFYRRLVSPCAS